MCAIVSGGTVCGDMCLCDGFLSCRSPEQQICRRQSSNEDRLVQNSQGNNSPTQSPTSPVKLLKLDKGREGNAAISPDDGISLTSVVNGPVPVTDAVSAVDFFITALPLYLCVVVGLPVCPW